MTNQSENLAERKKQSVFHSVPGWQALCFFVFLFFMNLLFSVTVYLVKAFKEAVVYGEAVKKNVEEKLCTASAFFTAREPGQHYVKDKKLSDFIKCKYVSEFLRKIQKKF